MADGSLLKDVYDKDVLALWSEKDEEASEKWRQDKRADFDAGGS